MKRGRFERQALDDAMRRTVERALREAEPSKTSNDPATAGGDPERMRGVPIRGRGAAGGAIKGTRPGGNLG